MPDVGPVTYVRCPSCGCVYAKTLLDWPSEQWDMWCTNYHARRATLHEDPDDPRRQSRLQAQARSLAQAFVSGWIGGSPWLDYGAGDGRLSTLIHAQLAERSPSRAEALHIDRFDRYVLDSSYVSQPMLLTRSYSVVINTAVVEHVRSRAELDVALARIDTTGTLALHTLVRAEIPRDPSWFYLLSVHTAFFTNEGMTRLFEQWGLRASTYDIDARLWLGFRGGLPSNLPQEWPVDPQGFTAYWP